jgi:hypothetical protein
MNVNPALWDVSVSGLPRPFGKLEWPMVSSAALAGKPAAAAITIAAAAPDKRDRKVDLRTRFAMPV